jgi:hypothetical protein
MVLGEAGHRLAVALQRVAVDPLLPSVVVTKLTTADDTDYGSG